MRVTTLCRLVSQLLVLLPFAVVAKKKDKAQPQAVGPAVGKSIRKLYALLADGLDVEVAHRFAEWFAVHMSNFNFQWVWKEW